MKNTFDRIIVSCDDSYFLEYWYIVYLAWKKFYPEKKISIAFVTNRSYEDALVKKMGNFYDEVVLFKPILNVPTANLAKIARHFLATKYGNEIFMIEDIDTVPLQREFVDRVIGTRNNETILAVGHEVYGNGKFPTSNICSESFFYKKIYNPNNLSWEDFIISLINLRVFDHKEAPNISPSVFSDESLTRALISRYCPNENCLTKTRRNVDPQNDWVDRSWWKIDLEKLNNGKYIICNFLRPFSQNYEKIYPIIKYIIGRECDKNEIIILE